MEIKEAMAWVERKCHADVIKRMESRRVAATLYKGIIELANYVKALEEKITLQGLEIETLKQQLENKE